MFRGHILYICIHRSKPRNGFVILKGPMQLHNVFFDGFTNNELHMSGAIGFRECKSTKSIRSMATNVKFAFNDSVRYAELENTKERKSFICPPYYTSFFKR